MQQDSSISFLDEGSLEWDRAWYQLRKLFGTLEGGEGWQYMGTVTRDPEGGADRHEFRNRGIDEEQQRCMFATIRREGFKPDSESTRALPRYTDPKGRRILLGRGMRVYVHLPPCQHLDYRDTLTGGVCLDCGAELEL